MAVFPVWGWGSSVVSHFGLFGSEGHFKVGLISEVVVKLIFHLIFQNQKSAVMMKRVDSENQLYRLHSANINR